MPLNSNERDKLVEALLQCDCMKSVNSRESIVRDLSDDIQQRIRWGGTTIENVGEIVRVCSQFPDGIETLLKRVRFFEGESFAWMRLEQVSSEILAKQAAPEPVAPPLPTVGSSSIAPAPSSPVNQAGQPIQVFFSYSHKDEALRDELSAHLAVLKRQRVISEWHDRQIPAGEEWKEAIDDRINQAQVILLLISADFLASDYCHEIDMMRALKRHEDREAVVIPVILRPCDWKGAPFGKLQPLPKDARPVTMWPNRDEAFTNVAEGIRRAVEKLR